MTVLFEYEDDGGDQVTIYTNDSIAGNYEDGMVTFKGVGMPMPAEQMMLAVRVPLDLLRDSLFGPIDTHPEVLTAVSEVMAAYALSHAPDEKIQWRGMASALAAAGLLRPAKP